MGDGDAPLAIVAPAAHLWPGTGAVPEEREEGEDHVDARAILR